MPSTEHLLFRPSSKTFHHTRDPIYQRLIVAILKGYYVPPLRVAAVADKVDE
jgi:hypothetical protein